MIMSWLVSNWLTVASILISGVISLVISAVYYYKGNRSNLQMTVLFPIMRLLNESYSKKNYEKLCELSQSYCVKYLKENERRNLIQLVSNYGEITEYNEIKVNVISLISYFESVLNKNGIETKNYPLYIEDDLVDYDYPPNYKYSIYENLENVLEEYTLEDGEIEIDEYEARMIYIFNYFQKKYFSKNTNEKVKYFTDQSIVDILEKSKYQKKWDDKFKQMSKVKNEFLNLKAVKELSHIGLYL